MKTLVKCWLLAALAAALLPACGGGGGGGGGGGPAVLTVATAGLAGGTEGVAYNALLAAVSGTPPYAWTLASGSLPAGLNLAADGTVSGTPSTPGTSAFTVRVSDAAVPPATAERLLSISVAAPPLVIVNVSLPSGSRTVPYSQQLLATGGVQPYGWSSTALPAGLSMGAGGLITGTPTTQTTTNVTFTVTDAAAVQSNRLLPITIGPAPSVTVGGTFTFEKVPISVAGLDVPGRFPQAVRACYVGLEDQTSPGTFFSTTYTDAAGNYSLPAPQNSSVKLYLYALHASAAGSIKVVDRASGTNPKATWAITTPAIAVATVDVTASDWTVPDSTRINGAFNIVDVVYGIQQTVLGLNPAAVFGAATIEFSPNFYSGTSYFSGSNGYILGDRSQDSDDFDDPVIAHEYGHYLQTTFSRSDSTGGDHATNQTLDPRLAFAEGAATFMGQMFLGSPLYIDTFPAGASMTNLETSATVGKGYWNERSVMKILWDCFDATNEAGDTLTLPFSAFWTVFDLDMGAHTFVYLVDFVDSLVARNAASGAAIAAILNLESITYTPGAVPPVPNPWPDLLQSGVAFPSSVDSFVNQQWTLMESTDVFYFTILGARTVTVTLVYTGTGTSPAAPGHSVDFYVFGNTGHGYNGNPLYTAGYAPLTGPYTESKSVSLPAAGSYGVVATSCWPYPPAVGTSPTIFSSATYTITAVY